MPHGKVGSPAEQSYLRHQWRYMINLYELAREELTNVPDTFPIVRRKDEAKWGEFRTKRLVMEAYDASEELVGVSTHWNNASKS